MAEEIRLQDRNLALEAVRVTERAAIASSAWMGRGDEKAADQAAVDAMRQALNVLDIDGTVVIGEGERDEAPMLYIGERVGSGHGPKVDIALDPLEGTTITATGGPNAIACLAMAGEGGFLNAPDTYMDKIAVGGGLPEGVIDIDAAAASRTSPSSPRPRSVDDRRSGGPDPRPAAPSGADRERARGRRADPPDPRRRRRRRDRDRAAGQRHRHLLGIGGAPEGVLAAAALRSIGGQMQGRLHFRNDDERGRARGMGITDLDRVYDLHDLARRRRDVRRHRRDRRHHAERRAPLPGRRDHPFDRDALQDRHGAGDRDRALPAAQDRGGAGLRLSLRPRR